MNFRKYSTYKNCFINDEAADLIKKGKSVICRYMPLSKMMEWVDKSIMTFASPDEWVDPLERKYLKTKLKISSQQE